MPCNRRLLSSNHHLCIKLQVQILLIHSNHCHCILTYIAIIHCVAQERTLKALKCDLLEVEISDSIIEAHFMFPVRQPVPSQVSSGVCLHVRAVNRNRTVLGQRLLLKKQVRLWKRSVKPISKRHYINDTISNIVS